MQVCHGREKLGVPVLSSIGWNSKTAFMLTTGDSCRHVLAYDSEAEMKDADYMFCPLPHRHSILHLMCKHFCQHPIPPEHHDQARTPKQIHRDAVLEAYHCKANNLREVWEYLWTCYNVE